MQNKLQSTPYQATDLEAKCNLFSVWFKLAFGRTHGLVLLHVQDMTDLCAPNTPRHLVLSIPLRTNLNQRWFSTMLKIYRVIKVLVTNLICMCLCVNRCSKIPGVFCSHSERSKNGVWWGHPCCALPTAHQGQEEGLCATLRVHGMFSCVFWFRWDRRSQRGRRVYACNFRCDLNYSEQLLFYYWFTVVPTYKRTSWCKLKTVILLHVKGCSLKKENIHWPFLLSASRLVTVKEVPEKSTGFHPQINKGCNCITKAFLLF